MDRRRNGGIEISLLVPIIVGERVSLMEREREKGRETYFGETGEGYENRSLEMRLIRTGENPESSHYLH